MSDSFLLWHKGKRRAESGNGAVRGDEESGRVWGKERRAVAAEDKEDGGKDIGGKTDVRIRVGQNEDGARYTIFCRPAGAGIDDVMIAPPVRNKEMFVVAGAREQRSGEGKDAQAGGRLLARVSQSDLPRLLRGVLPDSAEGAFAEADKAVFYVIGGENAAHFIKRQPLRCAARVDGHARL